MKIAKIFVVFLSILAFSCDLANLLGKDNLDDHQVERMGDFLRNGFRTVIDGAEYLIDSFEEMEDEYEYFYVDEQGNVVYVDYDGVGYLPKVDVVEGSDEINVSAGGVVTVGDNQKAVTSQATEVKKDLGEGAATSQATEVKKDGTQEAVTVKVTGSNKGVVPKVKESRRNRVKTLSQIQQKPKEYISPLLGTRVAHSYGSRGINCKSREINSTGGMIVYISDDEKKKFESLEKYVGSAIKINGRSRSDQDKFNNMYQKFFKWLKKEDSSSSFKRLKLGRDMKKVFDFIRSNASDSKEIQNLITVSSGSEILRSAGINSASDIKSDAEVEALMRLSVSDRFYSGYCLSLFFQRLADSFEYCYDCSDNSFDYVFRQMESVLDGTAYKSGDFATLKSKIKE
ncbi:hypothetical protein [Borrelia turicatae]|uniref:Lipoprotein n=1 Tax=Borrelia turicatae (strain 91E135) TaxID=314724 RepID=T1ECP4_BORT9|nr:hypothetical protein [Borrelia turicatae]ADN26517.1 hypothetical protein BTA088 [Borrelia turicatae 91E135]UPA14014.1 hypothetical protein bt91E135_001178 [Borrelia turicatae 91E135]